MIKGKSILKIYIISGDARPETCSEELAPLPLELSEYRRSRLSFREFRRTRFYQGWIHLQQTLIAHATIKLELRYLLILIHVSLKKKEKFQLANSKLR